LDDGSGIQQEKVAAGAGLGMRSMRYRAELIGASLEVAARDTGGTRVAVTLSMPH